LVVEDQYIGIILSPHFVKISGIVILYGGLDS